jgi:hypothetical protein
MTTESAEPELKTKRRTSLNVLLELALIPVAIGVAAVAVPLSFVPRWLQKHREHTFRLKMKSSGRLITWQVFLHSMRNSGGTCIEEKFSPKGPVRFWWTPDDVPSRSPHEIIDWFTMRKGRRGDAFVYWCRERYTNADTGSAVLVDAPFVPRREIYGLWAECRSESGPAHWVEVAPPEILPINNSQ